jgi:hypothetical protein
MPTEVRGRSPNSFALAGAASIAVLALLLHCAAPPLGPFGTIWLALAYASICLLIWIGARGEPAVQTRVLTVFVTLQRKRPRLCAVSSLR